MGRWRRSMLSSNKSYVLTSLFVATSLIFSSSPAYAIYDGKDVVNEYLVGTTYMNSGCSVTPIAPRILIMAQHCQAIPGKTHYTYPGEAYNSTRTVTALKSFVPIGEFKGGREYDIMAVVVDKDMPINKNVVIATKEDIDKIKASAQEFVIYGFGITEDGFKPKRAKKASFILYPGQDLGNGISAEYDSYISLMPKDGKQETCDGDSGAPAYVFIDNIIYYIGPVISGNKIYGCGTQKEITPISRVQMLYPFISIVEDAKKWILQNSKQPDIIVKGKKILPKKKTVKK